MGVIFNVQNSQLLTLSLPTEKIFQVQSHISLWQKYCFLQYYTFKMILGRLIDWTLILYGTSSDPLERNQHALNAAVPVHTDNASSVLGKKQIFLLLINFLFTTIILIGHRAYI